MLINVLLVDDEPHIRMILKKVIERQNNFHVIGECDNMADALILFNQHRPDVVFMDIEINGSSGIDCARVIAQVNPKTKIIFATAHSEYMSNAFELYAFDYLVKPFDIERIKHTLERIEMEKTAEHEILSMNSTGNMSKKTDENSEINKNDIKLSGWNKGDTNCTYFDEKDDKDKKINLEELHQASSQADLKLMIKGKESMNFIDIKDLVLVERENNSTVLYTATGESYQTSMTMGEIGKRLNGKQFMRSHKSYIINISKIKSIEPYGRWTFIVRLKGIAKDALITKEKFEQVRKIFG